MRSRTPLPAAGRAKRIYGSAAGQAVCARKPISPRSPRNVRPSPPRLSRKRLPCIPARDDDRPAEIADDRCAAGTKWSVARAGDIPCAHRCLGRQKRIRSRTTTWKLHITPGWKLEKERRLGDRTVGRHQIAKLFGGRSNSDTNDELLAGCQLAESDIRAREECPVGR
jgi:hypothetical protein